MTPERTLHTYLVEDNATIRETLVVTLDDLVGITVSGWASTEQEACHWLMQTGAQWDLAIVDLFLEQGSGQGVLEACRARRQPRKMIVLSNYVTPLTRMRCMSLGADAVFDKSTDIGALIDYCTALRKELQRISHTHRIL